VDAHNGRLQAEALRDSLEQIAGCPVLGVELQANGVEAERAGAVNLVFVVDGMLS
jgi:hypothetical protein